MGPFLEIVLNQAWRAFSVRSMLRPGTDQWELPATRIPSHPHPVLGLREDQVRRDAHASEKSQRVAHQISMRPRVDLEAGVVHGAAKHDAPHHNRSQNTYHVLPKRIMMIFCDFSDGNPDVI